MMIDEIDQQLLTLLQEDARYSNAVLAEKVGLTASTVYERVKKLEKKGIIKGYVALVDPLLVGKGVTAVIRLTVGAPSGNQYSQAKKKFVKACLAEPDVLECYGVAGEDCYILKVRVATPKHLEKLIERLRSNSIISRTISNIVLSTFKEETRVIPLS